MHALHREHAALSVWGDPDPGGRPAARPPPRRAQPPPARGARVVRLRASGSDPAARAVARAARRRRGARGEPEDGARDDVRVDLRAHEAHRRTAPVRDRARGSALGRSLDAGNAPARERRALRAARALDLHDAPRARGQLARARQHARDRARTARGRRTRARSPSTSRMAASRPPRSTRSRRARRAIRCSRASSRGMRARRARRATRSPPRSTIR